MGRMEVMRMLINARCQSKGLWVRSDVQAMNSVRVAGVNMAEDSVSNDGQQERKEQLCHSE